VCIFFHPCCYYARNNFMRCTRHQILLGSSNQELVWQGI
jgi:hypothetical protein